MANLTDTLKVVPHLAETKNDGSPTVLANADTVGYRRATAVLYVGATDTTVDAKVQESDDKSSWSDVADAAMAQLSATDDGSTVAFEVAATSDRKRYLRLLVVVGAGATGAVLAAFWLLSHPTATGVPPADLKEVV